MEMKGFPKHKKIRGGMEEALKSPMSAAPPSMLSARNIYSALGFLQKRSKELGRAPPNEYKGREGKRGVRHDVVA